MKSSRCRLRGVDTLIEASILVAGVGNIFFGDDAFGCEVAQRLLQRELPEKVRVVDFGIRGFDLVYALLESYELSILIDAVPRGGEPGTLYVIEPDLTELDHMLSQESLLEAHAMDPLRVLTLVKSMGGLLNRVLLVGCEPSADFPDQGGLSKPVAASLDRAVELVHSLIKKNLNVPAHGSIVMCH